MSAVWMLPTSLCLAVSSCCFNFMGNLIWEPIEFSFLFISSPFFAAVSLNGSVCFLFISPCLPLLIELPALSVLSS